MKLLLRLLNLAGTALYGLGLAAVGAFWTNTRIIGVRESDLKERFIVANVLAWPMMGAADLLTSGGPWHFFGPLLSPRTRHARRLWRLFFTIVGLRYLVQQGHANRQPSALPSGVPKVSAKQYDFRAEVAAERHLPAHGVAGVLSRLNEIYRLEVNTHEVEIDDLPPEFDGFKIAQFSDLHYGHFNSTLYVQRCVQATLDLRPDLVALTGDFQHYADDIQAAAMLLAPFGEWSRAEKGGQGTYAVLGNHDTWNSTVDVTQALREAGIPVLNNKHIELRRNDARLYSAGVADMWALRSDLDLALYGIPDNTPVILLSHVPDMFMEASERGIALQLSGHMHGGQIKLPFAGAILSPSRYNRRYVEGFYKRRNSLLYSVRGLGGHPAIRLNCLPEIALFVLRCKRQ